MKLVCLNVFISMGFLVSCANKEKKENIVVENRKELSLFEVIPAVSASSKRPAKHALSVFKTNNDAQLPVSKEDILKGEFDKEYISKNGPEVKNCDDLKKMELSSSNRKVVEKTSFQYRKVACQIRDKILSSKPKDKFVPYTEGMLNQNNIPIAILNLIRAEKTAPDNRVTNVVAQGQSFYSTYGWQIIIPTTIADIDGDGKQEFLFLVVNYAQEEVFPPAYFAMTLENDLSLSNFVNPK